MRPDRLPGVAAYVADTIRARYPSLDVPFHSRWRHFDVGGVDRWGRLGASGLAEDSAERARVRIDLAVTSVLLDAGAGPDWRYREAATGEIYSRSEGLAVASFRLFESGALSSDPSRPLQADAEGLARCDEGAMSSAFQVAPGNPLVGVEGRARLMRSLEGALRARPDLFGSDRIGDGPSRPGRLYDWLETEAVDGRVAASTVLGAVLDGFGEIWPGRIAIDGRNLGDVWRHRAIRRDDETDGLVPFHKLSQWLTYSLVEPLEEAGLRVDGIEALTGLAEYRNGGLFVDLGAIEPRRAASVGEAHDVGSELVVEWRALTVALLDRIAPLVRAELGVDEQAMPMPCILEGGTWAAGRRAAAERRDGGGPPIAVRSDGTVF